MSDIRVVGENYPLAMLLGRSVLNFLDLHGVEDVYLEKSGEFYDRAARIIGFKIKDGRHYAFLPGMFTADHH